MRITIFTTLIHHDRGEDIQVSLSKEEATKKLAKYCRQWWEDWEDLKDKKMPRNPDDLINEYFASDAGADEWYEEFEDMRVVTEKRGKNRSGSLRVG